MARYRCRIFLSLTLTLILAIVPTLADAQNVDKATNALESAVELRADFEGVVGARVDELVKNWTLRAPKANPILLNAFQLRDREPKTDEYYVPWIGEFAGKYLTNSILLMQMSDERELPATVDAVVRALIASQDRSGYIGPFPRDKRLLAGWDLWGHYHSIVALLLYHERTGDADALETARRAGMFVCDSFVNAGKRVRDAGSDDMNFAIFSAMMKLYRRTGEERFFDAAQKFLAELEEFGNFYRLGLDGTEFYATPRPRWEPLHTIEGFADVYRATGDQTYKTALLAHWESILKRDVHNNGSFSTSEQAVGSPYRKGAIETCCSVAWIALTIEALRLTADVQCADALENALYNAVAAYEHPSGSWCSYDTPMNGRREASFHTIVFQSRPGQPELNCCSVNGPRGYAELVDWSVMKGREEDGKESLYINYYGPCRLELDVDGARVRIEQKTTYPLDGRVAISIARLDGKEFDRPVYLRVPNWAKGAALATPENDERQSLVCGQYRKVERKWTTKTAITLDLPLNFRTETADGDFAGRFSVFRGPLLLAYDQTFNEREEADLPTIDPAAFENATVELIAPNPTAERVGFYSPWLFVKVDATDGSPVFLTDFAWAGSLGTTYASLLRGERLAPPVPVCVEPKRNAAVASGAILFERLKPTDASDERFTVILSDRPDFATTIFETRSNDDRYALVMPEQTKELKPGETFYWKIVAENEFGRTESLNPPRAFSIDENMPAFDVDAYLMREKAKKEIVDLIVDPLNGEVAPTVGTVAKVGDAVPTEGKNGKENGAIELNGETSELLYELEEFPRADYELTLDFALEAVPTANGFAELVSAWTKGGDDPLRVAVNARGELYGAVEAPKGGMTQGKPIELGKWHSLRVVKSGENWKIELDGELVGELAVENVMSTGSTTLGLGCNPKYRDRPEFLKCKVARLKFKGRVAND